MAYRVYIVEDDPIVRKEIKGCLEVAGYEVCGEQGSASAALMSVMEHGADLVLVDIQLGAPPDGFWLGKQLLELRIPFLFLTSYSDPNTLERAKHLEPRGYIVKPFTEADLRVNIELALSRTSPLPHKDSSTRNDIHSDGVFIKSADGWDRVDVDGIDYLEACDNYLFVHLRKKRLMVRSTMKSFLEKLPKGQLIRCHRSYAVNPASIRSITSSHLLLETGPLPLGKQYRDDVLRRLILV